MKQTLNGRSSSKQNRKSVSPSNAQSMKDLNNHKLKKFGKCYHIVDSPQIVYDLCDKAFVKSRELDQPSSLGTDKIEITKKMLEQKRKILQKKGFFSNRGSHVVQHSNFTTERKSVNNNHTSYADKLSYCDDRSFYKTIKDRMKQLVEKVQNQADIMISEVMLLKQDILSSFFSEIVEKSKRECKEKGQLIHYIWNSMFSILEVVVKQLTRQKNHNQKAFLTENIQNHKKYQGMLEFDKERISELKAELEKAEVFNNTLVFNLRCKRRELRKSYIKLKLCTNKLNEYKCSFLDLQKDHIDLLMETREISKEMAEFMFKRRQQILQDKKKNFKLKFSKKANFANTKKEIQTEPVKELQLINEQLKAQFSKQYEKENQIALNENKKLKKLTNFLFEEATDEFAFYQNNDEIDDDLMASKLNTTFVDAQTDMSGFSFEVEEKACQIDYIQKIVHGMARNTGGQTVFQDEKPKKVCIENAVQINFPKLKQFKSEIQNKVYDLSFLFEGKKRQVKKITLQKQRRKRSLQKNRNSILESGQGSQHSIKYPSRKLLQNKNLISGRISQTEELSKFESLECEEADKENESMDQENSGQNQDVKESSSAMGWDVFKYVSKFALKKVQAKKNKAAVSLAFEKENLNNSIEEVDEQPLKRSYVKTQKVSRFSRQTSSLQTSPQKIVKKTSFVQETNISFVKKELKRQPISHRRKDSSSLQNKEQNLRKMLPKSGVVKYLNKTIQEHVDSMGTNDVLAKMKVQNPNLVINEEMEDFIKDKENEEKQKFFKNFSDSIATLIIDLDKNIESTKKYHKTLLPARHKNLCKIISNVYLKAYQILDKKENLYTLLNPLFKCFEMGYGMMKKYDLYSRMISFLSHVCIHKQQSCILYSFYFFTGIDQENPLSKRITSQDFQLYLKLLKNLSFNFNLSGFNVQNLYTSNLVLQRSTREVLIDEKLSETIIEKVISKVQEKLQKLTGVQMRSTQTSPDFASKFNSTMSTFSRTPSHSRTQSGWNTSRQYPKITGEEEQIKLDVFKCCQLIMEEILSIKKGIEDSYLPLINYAYEDEEETEEIRVDEELIQFIIRCQFKQKMNEGRSYQLLNNIFKINSLYNDYQAKLQTVKLIEKSSTSIKTLKNIRTLKSIKFIMPENEDDIQESESKQTLSLSEMCSFFLKANISDFNKTYYNALNVFKLREEAALSLCVKKMPEIRKFFEANNMKIELILLREIDEDGTIDQLTAPTPFDVLNASIYKNYATSRFEYSNETYQKQTVPFTLKQIQNKKILILCFLRFLENQVNQTMEVILGDKLNFLHTYMPMSKIKEEKNAKTELKIF